MQNNLRKIGDFVADFLDTCRNVRSLSVVDTYGMWAPAFSAQLEKIEVVGSSFPKSCSSLPELNFSDDSPTSNAHMQLDTLVSYLDGANVNY